MAPVNIDTGMPGPEESALKIPRDRWKLLAMSRRRWAEVDLAGDCRLLRTVVAEAPMMAQELGHDSADRFLTDYLGLDLDLVQRVVSWLDQEQPTEAVPLERANLLSHGGDRRSDQACQARENQRDNITLKRGTQAAYLKARLERDHPEQAAALERGEHRSARSAAIAAGIIKPVPVVRLVADPAKVAAAIRKHLDPQQVASLVEELQR